MLFRFEPLSFMLKSGLRALGARSWDECGLDKDVFNYNPDFDRYQRMETSDQLRFMAVRDDADDLIGYAAVIVGPNLHDKDACCAVVQDIFIEPAKRKGGTADRLLDILESQLVGIGVKHIAVASRNPVVDRWFSRRGYNSKERIWTKSLRSVQ